MAQLSYPITSAPRPTAARPQVTPSRLVRALQAMWQRACEQAERPGRFVPYY
ncbi:hypothetical protein [Hydrogenophaga sp. OTU3427]|uniref:hypothetical protein n=1 Tax=Hydrogenophaga sp. OTU3427 TaxID=3043856 RepID=UPI00313DD693